MQSAERALGKATGRRGERVLGLLALLALGASAVLSLAVAPPDASQGNVQRLMYIHVPAAWLAYLAFALVFVASVAFLRTGRSRWDRLAAAAAEIGVLFTALAILLGSLWGKPVWGTWWTWDPRLTTTAILLLIYVGYLGVRKLTDNPSQRGRWAAVVGVIGFLVVPINYLSVKWWRGLHQDSTIRLLGHSTIGGAQLLALLAGVSAFSVLFAYLMALRLRVGRLEGRAVAEVLSPRVSPRSVHKETAGHA
jgi:heme exporter protein C